MYVCKISFRLLTYTSLNVNLSLDDISISSQINNGDSTGSFGIKLNLSRLQLGVEASTSTQDGNYSMSSSTNISIDGISAAFWVGIAIAAGKLISLVPAV